MTRPTTDEAVLNILGGLSADAGCLVTASARQPGGIRPAVPAADLARAAKARQWRKGHGWTRKQTCRHTGLSARAI